MGGFVCGIARRRVEEVLMNPVHRALAILSEQRSPTEHEQAALLHQGPAFIRDKRIGFVVVDRTRTSPDFEALVTHAFDLRHVETNGSFVLYSTDRKSTRLNSSHSQISYAVFCLKKKKKIIELTMWI